MDIKGLQIRKSNVNKHTRKHLQYILEEKILKPIEISLSDVINELLGLEDLIRESFKSGNTEFCTPGKAKTFDEYKNAESQATFRAACLYNEIYPESPMEPGESFNAVRLKLTSIDDPNIQNLKHVFPKAYKEITEYLFFNESNCPLVKKTGLPDTKKIGKAKYGTNFLALPRSMDKIPEWVIPLIDIDEILRNNISTFLPLFRSVGGRTVQYTKDEQFITNIIL